jgi:hypothetical protein
MPVLGIVPADGAAVRVIDVLPAVVVAVKTAYTLPAVLPVTVLAVRDVYACGSKAPPLWCW